MLSLSKKLLLLLTFVVSTSMAQTISFKGLTYNVITSPITNQQWLDRNLGAKKVCLTKVDESCFGDYYQWGRSADGHEKANAQVIGKYDSSTTSSGAFIKVKEGSSFDWKKQSSDDLWSSSKALNNVCPNGFRVPTIDELSSETNNNQNFLKLPLSGYKSFCNGTLVQTKKQGAIWSSTPYENDAYYLDIRNTSFDTSTSSRADAFPVRCIKNK